MRLLNILLVLIASAAECLMMSRVLVPQYKLVGGDALLKCEYDLGRDRLYAVKWYKDNEEFFRYVPRFNPPIYTHPVEGVRVESSKSNDKRVLVRNLTVRSTGVYRCEVSAEAPSFASIMGEGRMTVVYLPKEAPQITGVNVREEYEVGDVLDLNCTSAKSFPPAKLSWYINDSPVDVPWTISLYPAPTDPPSPIPPPGPIYHQLATEATTASTGHSLSSYNSHLMVSTLRLQLTLESRHFGLKGTAKVRCVARISPLFWQDGDERILGHHGRHSKKKIEEQLHHRALVTSTPTSAMTYEDGDSQLPREDVNSHHLDQHKTYDNHHIRHDNTLLQYDLDEEDGEGHYYYGFGELPAFQREALVLVRGGGCSILLGDGTSTGWTAHIRIVLTVLISILGRRIC